ncbi:MAG: TolC family protein [Planctomycetota bacterium]|nr:TolC family protein [Planctomycetota bacterium]
MDFLSSDALFAAAQLLPEAEHGLALARASHAAGQSSLFVVLDAQERLLAARRRQVAAQREAAAAAAALERALGCRAPRVMPQPDAD